MLTILTVVVPIIVIVIAMMIAEYLRLKKKIRELTEYIQQLTQAFLLGGGGFGEEVTAELNRLNERLEELRTELEAHPLHNP